MDITPDTKIKLKIAQVVAVIGFMVPGILWVDAQTDAIAENTQKIYALTKSLKLATLDDQIGDLNRERRGYKTRIATINADDQPELYAQMLDNIHDVDDELQKLQKIHDCVVADKEPCE